MQQKKIPCAYLRGGTSKGIFFHEKDLPADRAQWPALFLRVMGSPDAKQIDGMGGTVTSTSKIAVISKSARSDADIDYTFFQVAVDRAMVDDSVNCGNLSSAVGPFAIDEGLVAAVEPETTVRIYNTNTDKYITAKVPVADGCAAVQGKAAIAGVPGTGAGITLCFEQPAGSATGQLFPTGQRMQALTLPDGREVQVSILDCGLPVVFAAAADLGLQGGEGLEAATPLLLERIEQLRGCAAVALGFTTHWSLAAQESMGAPDVVLVSAPRAYTALGGAHMPAESMHLCVRAFTGGKMHRAFPVTDAICTGAAVKLQGTLPHAMAAAQAGEAVCLGHISGSMEVAVATAEEEIRSVSLLRTARRIMDGCVYIPNR